MRGVVLAIRGMGMAARGRSTPGPTATYAYSGSLYTWAKEHGGKILPATARPSPGYAVFFGNGPSSSAHVAIVQQVLPNGQLITIDGNYRTR